MGKIKTIAAGNLIMMEWKAKDTLTNIENNNLSYSKDAPLLVSYHPDQRKYLIRDGHHRAMELFNEGKRHLICLISENEPKIYNINYPTTTLKKFLTL